MQIFYVYCPDCDAKSFFHGVETVGGESKEQLSDIWRDSHVCKVCGGTHVINAEGNGDFKAHFPINERKEDSKTITRFWCGNRDCWYAFLAYDKESCECPECGVVSSDGEIVDLTKESVNPYE